VPEPPKSKLGTCDYHQCEKGRTTVYRCEFCGGYFCKKHLKSERPILPTPFGKKRSEMIDYHRLDGHPCPEFMQKEKVERERRRQSLDRMKEPPQEQTTEAAERIRKAIQKVLLPVLQKTPEKTPAEIGRQRRFSVGDTVALGEREGRVKDSKWNEAEKRWECLVEWNPERAAISDTNTISLGFGEQWVPEKELAYVWRAPSAPKVPLTSLPPSPRPTKKKAAIAIIAFVVFLAIVILIFFRLG
jgi:hypothetical protein